MADERLDAIRRQRFSVRAALDAFELALTAPSAGRAEQWLAMLTERAGSLAAAFAEHVRVTEMPGGVFDDCVGRAPRLANKVEHLRRDHVEITEALDRLSNGRTGDADAAVDSAIALMGAIVRHRSAGSDLLYEAYFVDIDAAD